MLHCSGTPISGVHQTTVFLPASCNQRAHQADDRNPSCNQFAPNCYDLAPVRNRQLQSACARPADAIPRADDCRSLQVRSAAPILVLCNGSQSFDDAAFANRAVPALSNHGFQFATQRGEVGQFALHFRQMFAGNGVHGIARLLFPVGKVEQRPNLFNGKTKGAGTPRESEAADMGG